MRDWEITWEWTAFTFEPFSDFFYFLHLFHLTVVLGERWLVHVFSFWGTFFVITIVATFLPRLFLHIVSHGTRISTTWVASRILLIFDQTRGITLVFWGLVVECGTRFDSHRRAVFDSWRNWFEVCFGIREFGWNCCVSRCGSVVLRFLRGARLQNWADRSVNWFIGFGVGWSPYWWNTTVEVTFVVSFADIAFYKFRWTRHWSKWGWPATGGTVVDERIRNLKIEWLVFNMLPDEIS